MSYQVLRVETFNKNSLSRIGGETERTSKHHRNQDIDDSLTPMNFYFKKSDGGLYNEWKTITEKLNATFKETKKSVAFEGIVITSDKAFFEKLGYVKGEAPPEEMLRFFDKSYRYVLRSIGYHATDENVLSAVVHLDETTPHLQLYYIPVVNMGKKKVYQKDSRGKVLRNEKGSPIQAKDENGKSLYEYGELPQPKVCHSEFWDQRGGQLSYGLLQDGYFEAVAKSYGLNRGEVGSNKTHTTKYQWEKEQQEKALKQLEERKLKLSKEAEPLEAYINAFREAIDGKRPFFKGQLEKQLIGLTAQYKLLEEAKKISDKDRAQLFNELKNLQAKIPELEKHKDFLLFLSEFAPDKLQEAKAVAHSRKTEKAQQKKKPKERFWSK